MVRGGLPPDVAGNARITDCLDTGHEPQLSSRKALAATELIFATYESSRRGRVTLPLEIEDLPLLAGLEEGLWKPV